MLRKLYFFIHNKQVCVCFWRSFHVLWHPDKGTLPSLNQVFGSPKRHGRTPQSAFKKLTVFLDCLIANINPPRTNMEPKNWWWLGDVSPFQRGYLFHFFLFFSGVYPLKIVLGSLFSFGREPVFRNYVISFLGREDQLERCIRKIAL